MLDLPQVSQAVKALLAYEASQPNPDLLPEENMVYLQVGLQKTLKERKAPFRM